MKTLFAAITIVAVAGSVFACVNTTKPCGPIHLVCDAAGVGVMTNTGGTAFQFDGYTVASAGGLIDNAAWMTFVLNTTADMTNFPPSVGQTVPQAFGWGELANDPALISEAHLTSAAILQPGGTVNLGAAFPGWSQADLTFTYIDAASGGSWEGPVTPEPATMSLLALGGLAMLRRRR